MPNTPYTDRVREILATARLDAAVHGYAATRPEHLALAIIDCKDAMACAVLADIQVDTSALTQGLRLVLEKVPPLCDSSDIPAAVGTRVRRVLEMAIGEASRLERKEVGTEHLLIAIVREACEAGTPIADAYDKHGMTPKSVRDSLQRLMNVPEVAASVSDASDSHAVATVSSPSSPRKVIGKPGKIKPKLDRFTRDLTALAREGSLDAVFGREVETERLYEILLRRKKANPVLLGEPGVGKTALVEALANRIVQDPKGPLGETRILSLDLASLVEGTVYRGQFEERFRGLMEEAITSETILFIDELHTILGAGSAQGTMDAGNMLKPFLARGQLRVIGATTLAEYRKYIEPDGALERRFQPLVVEAPSLEVGIAIMQGLAPEYAAYHKIAISPDVAAESAKLAARYVTDRVLPDSAIDLLDEGCARVALRKREDMVLRTEDLAEVLSRRTGIPVGTGNHMRSDALALERNMAGRIVGQDAALAAVAAAVRRARAGLAPASRPIGSFLFLGPHGVGKTSVALALAELIHHDKKALIRLDMSEYGEKFNVSRLTGAPPGYVGYEEGGALTNAVRRKPHSVVLFDEIEKAHPDVLLLLLQILDNGQLTDSSGKTVDFRHTIVILTSNIGAAQPATLGFGSTKADDGRWKRAAMEIIPPELWNRFDSIIPFKALDATGLERLVRRQVEIVVERVADLGFTLALAPALEARLVELSAKDPEGARGIRRLVERYVGDPVADAVLLSNARCGTSFNVGLPEDSPVVKIILPA